MQQIESSEMYCKDIKEMIKKTKKMIKHPTSVIFHVHNIQISK